MATATLPATRFIDRVLGLRKQNQQSLNEHVDELALRVAKHDFELARGAKHPKTKLPDEELTWQVIDAAKMTDDQFQKLVARYRQALELWTRCCDVEQVKAEAEQLEQAWIAADLAEGERRRQAIAELLKLESERDAAIARHGDAMAAEQAFRSSIPETQRERELAIEARAVAGQIQDLEILLRAGALTHNGMDPTPANELAAAQAKLAHMQSRNGNASPEQIERQKAHVAQLAKPVAEIQQKLAALRIRGQQLNAEIDMIRADLLRKICE